MRYTWKTLLVIALFGALIGLWISPGRGVAATSTPPAWTACQAAHQNPHGWVGRSCTDRGWLVKHRVVLSPDGLPAYLNLPECERNVPKQNGSTRCVSDTAHSWPPFIYLSNLGVFFLPTARTA